MNPADYNSVYSSLGAQYDPQTQLINQQIAQLAPQQQAQQSALDQAKINAFKDIDNSANSKGVLFSGFSPDQQAQYIGTKYLPAVADLNSTFQNNKTTLLGQINDLNAKRIQQAQGTVSDYQKNQADAAYKNAQLQLGYARLAQDGQNKANTPLTTAQVRSSIQGGLQSVIGKDGFVSPQDYALGLKDWLAAGLPRAEFNKQYSSYRNPTNTYYDYAIKQAGL